MARKSRYAVQSPDAAVSVQESLRAGVYLRLSVESEEDFEFNSLGHQKEICMHYLTNHPEMALCGTYIDNGYTGTNFSRDEFQRMIEDARRGNLNCIVVKDLSRFGRNYIEMDRYLNVLFPEWKIRFIAVCDNIDTINPQDEGIILPLKNVFNDYYSRDISQKIKSSIHVKIGNQQFVPSSFVIPYGYLRDGENMTFQVDREVAPVVQRIFELRAEGMSFTKIAGTLNNENITAPGRLRYLRGQVSNENYANSCWSRDFIRKLTSNPVYIGQRVHGKWVKDSFLSNYRAARPDEVTVVPNAHEAIISDELYARVQRVNGARGKPRSSQQRKQPQNPLISIVKAKSFCGDCGKKMTFANSKRKGCSVECSLYLRSGQTRCFCHYMRVDRIGDIICDELNRQIALTKVIKKNANVWDNQGNSALKSEKAVVEQQKAIMDNKRMQLLEDFAEGLIERSEYDALWKRVNQDYEQISDRFRCIEQQLAVVSQKAELREGWISTMSRFDAAESMDHGLMNALIDRILIRSEGNQRTVEIVFKYRDVYKECLEAVYGKTT